MDTEYLLYDEQYVAEFAEAVLPELKKDEVLLLYMAARKKYGGVSRSHELLSRKILKDTSPGYFLSKVKQLADVGGIYSDKATGEILPARSLAVYVDIMPKSTMNAFKTFNNDMLVWLYENLHSSSFDQTLFRHMDRKLFSAIHRSNSRKPYWIIDLDKDDYDLCMGIVSGYEKEDIVWISKTHGGYHIIVKRNNNSARMIRTLLEDNMYVVDVGHEATPVPGTYQGGAKVKRQKA